MKPRDSALSSDQTCSVRNCSRGWPVLAPNEKTSLPVHWACGAFAVHGLVGSKSTAMSKMPRLIVPRSTRTM
jgi:hypothetical protein